MINFWSNRKVLVTGAAGFIGSHLVQILIRNGAQVTGMVHYDSRSDYSNLAYLSAEEKKSLKIAAGDICDPFQMRKLAHEVDTVFHLAALIGIPYSYIAPQAYMRTNIEGTLNVLEACREQNVRRLVHTSTSETYGTAQYTPIDEKHPLVGQSPYSASKIAADKLVESYHLSFGVPCVTLKPFNTFGPRQSTRAVIPTIIAQALSPDSCIRLGSVTPVRDFNFVLDTADAFLKAAEHDACIGQVLNTGTGEGRTVEETVHSVLEILGVKKKIEADDQRKRPEKSEVFQLISDSSRLRQLTGWRPATAFSEALTLTINFFREHADQTRVRDYSI